MQKLDVGSVRFGHRPEFKAGGLKGHVVLIDADKRPFPAEQLGCFEGMACAAERCIHECVLRF